MLPRAASRSATGRRAFVTDRDGALQPDGDAAPVQARAARVRLRTRIMIGTTYT